jgi:hypothetical protein
MQTETQNPTADQSGIFALTNQHLVGISVLLGLGYFIYSFFSNGFYQHDEAAHYQNMLRFWSDPSIILNNWAKPGYKVVMLPFSILGPVALKLVNSLFAAFSGYVACKLMEKLGYSNAWLALFLLAVQPFWIQLGFRNYSEIMSAFLLISAMWAHYSNRYWLAALLLSFLLTIRQEMYPLAFLYGLMLLYQKHWKAALVVGTFPLIHNFVGWWVFGDPLYLINSVLGFSNDIQSSYPRQGFWHYPKMSLTVFGGVALTGLLVYLAQVFFKKMRVHWLLVGTVFLYVSMHIVFSIQRFEIGPSTGGNLRYLLIISPLVAVIGAIGIQRIRQYAGWKEKRVLLFILVPFLIITFFFLTHKHNNVLFTYARDFTPFIIVFLVTEWMMLSLKPRLFFRGLLALGLLSVVLVVRPLMLSEEDAMVKKTAEYIDLELPNAPRILMNHTLLYYYLGVIPEQKSYDLLSTESLNEAPVGSIIVWEPHYAYRPFRNPESLPLDHFLSDSAGYRYIHSPDSTSNGVFSIHLFEKLEP